MHSDQWPCTITDLSKWEHEEMEKKSFLTQCSVLSVQYIPPIVITISPVTPEWHIRRWTAEAAAVINKFWMQKMS